MILCLIWGLLFPFLGTAAGAALVWWLNWDHSGLRRCFSGAAAGIMSAAAVFGLLLPGCRLSPDALYSAAGGAVFLLLTGKLTGSRVWLVALAVVLHNIPEGMAAGAGFGGWRSGSCDLSDALAVGIGIGLQNVPDGAMVSLPLRQDGMSRPGAFSLGILSGLVEPVAAVGAFFWADRFAPALASLMGFAAGAMLYVVAVELIPGMEVKKGQKEGLYWALAGLSFMALAL